MVSSFLVKELKGNIFERNMFTLNAIVTALIVIELWRTHWATYYVNRVEGWTDSVTLKLNKF